MPRACRNLTETIILLNTDDDAFADWKKATKKADREKFAADWGICDGVLDKIKKRGGAKNKAIQEAVGEEFTTMYNIIRS